MIDTDDSSESMIFPSQAWFSEYGTRVSDDEAYEEKSEGWGVDFNGDFVYEMTDMPVEEIDTDAMPESLRSEFETYITETDSKGYVGRAYMTLEDGECSDCYLIESVDEVDTGFHLSATTDTWKALLRQEIGVIDGLMGGDFELDGDMQKVLQYSDAAVRLTELASDIDAEFVDEQY